MIRIIPAERRHFRYVVDAFTHEYSEQAQIPKRVAFIKIMSLVTSPEWSTVVAVAADDDDEILGFFTFKDAHTVAWLQVKRIYRGHGVGKALLQHLLPTAEVRSAFVTSSAVKFAAKHEIHLRWAPYLPDAAIDELTHTVLAAELEAKLL